MKLSCAVALTGPGEEADGRRTGWREICGEFAAVEVASGGGDGLPWKWPVGCRSAS